MTRINAFDWTSEVITELTRLWESKEHSAREIARMFGVSKNAILGKAHRLGLSQKHPRKLGRPENPATEKPKPVRALKRIPGADVPLAVQHTWRGLEATDLPPEDPATAVTLADLSDKHCKWPLGDPKSPEFRFCGAQTVKDLPYCKRHCRMAYTPEKPRPVRAGWAA